MARREVNVADEFDWILHQAAMLGLLFAWVFIAAGIIALGEKIAVTFFRRSNEPQQR